MNAFITGSYAYGVPHKDSDIDLVVCLDGIDEDTLWDHSESDKSCRFGKLNLILLAPDRFAEWKRINDDLLSRGYDVGREEAVAAFQSAGFGVDDYGRCSVEVSEGQVEYDNLADDPDYVPRIHVPLTLSEIAEVLEQ